MNLYRAAYAWPDGRRSWVTFTAPRSDALRYAADYVRCFTGGELLALREDRPLQRAPFQLTLRG